MGSNNNWSDLLMLAEEYEAHANEIKARIKDLRPNIYKVRGEQRLILERRIRYLYDIAANCSQSTYELKQFIKATKERGDKIE